MSLSQAKVSPDVSNAAASASTTITSRTSSAEKYRSSADLANQSKRKSEGQVLFIRGRSDPNDKSRRDRGKAVSIIPEDNPETFVFGAGNNEHALLEVIDARRKLEEIYRTKGIVISPHSLILKRWNVALVWIIVLAVLWTPFQIAFTPYDIAPSSVNFVLNRIVDGAFVTDTVIGFFVSYNDGVSGEYIRNSKDIAKHYISTWFFFDAISTCCGFVDFIDTSELSDHAMAAWQLAKLLRLARLPKTFQGDKTKSAQRLFEDRLSYNVVSLLKFIVSIAVLAHWIACAWRGVVNFGEPGKTWMVPEDLGDKANADVYALCMYFAATTITTIGYG
jgi:hypothetical protein